MQSEKLLAWRPSGRPTSAALSRAEALVAHAIQSLVRTEQALALVRQLLQNLHKSLGVVHPLIGVVDDWMTGAMFAA